MKLEVAAKTLEVFQRGALTKRLADLERSFAGSNRSQASKLCTNECVNDELVQSALALKTVAGQINVLIHAVGIIIALPRILDLGERVEYLSLGAGNTGRAFDLATDRRIAEFKFIQWTGGAETIRQNALFKDFVGLAEAKDGRRKCLYLLDLTQPLKFFTSRRSLSSVLSKNASLAARFRAVHGARFDVVADYYRHRRRRVELVDLLPIVGELRTLPNPEALAE